MSTVSNEATTSDNSAHNPTVGVRFIDLEGPPGSGKTWSLSNLTWDMFPGRHRVVKETIPAGVLEDFYDRNKQASVAYTFEHFMIAIRSNEDNVCRNDTARVHIRDRTLLGSVAFHIANFMVGNLTRERADELFSLNLIEHALKPTGDKIETNTIPERVIVYFGDEAHVCRKRVSARGDVDAIINDEYHRIVTFVYAVIILWIAKRRSDVGLVAQCAGALHLRHGDDGAIHWSNSRAAVEIKARQNLDIQLTRNQMRAFVHAMSFPPFTNDPEFFTGLISTISSFFYVGGKVFARATCPGDTWHVDPRDLPE